MQLKKVIFLLILFIFLYAPISNAANLKTYTIADGLLDNTINCILQDNNGILWFGSNKGITRFDGINFKSFQSSNADERVKVLAIYQDKNNIMWAITEIGVDIWTGTEFQEFFKFHGLTSFSLDGEGNRWLGSKNGIIVLGEGEGVKEESIKKSLSHIKGVTALFKDKESNIWIGTSNGIYYYDGDEVEHFTMEDGLTSNNIHSIYEAGENIFLATDNGISYYDGITWDSYTTKNGLIDNYTTAIFHDFRGKYWFGTKSGLSIYDDTAVNFYEAWSSMTSGSGLAGDHITSLYIDRSANLWIGTKNGVTKYNIAFDYLIKVQGIKEQLTTPVFYDSEKNIWMSIENGVTALSDNLYNRLQKEEGISGKVLSIYQDPDDETIYLGTTAGVDQIDQGDVINTIKPLKPKTEIRFLASGANIFVDVMPDKDIGLVGRKILAISKDDDGDFWFATDKALNKLSYSQWTTYTVEEGLLNNHVNDLFLNDDGTLYIATESGINTYFDEEFREPITTDSGLPHNNVKCIYKDTDGNLWFGTKRGVGKYDGENFTNFTAEDGLSGDTVNVVFEDSRGFFWFATEGGLTKYDGENFSIFTTVDGLLVNEILSIAEDDDGILWFGTDYGVVRYKPDTVPPSSYVTNAPDKPLVMPKYTFEVVGGDLNSKREELFISYKFDDGKWSEFAPRTVIYIDRLKNGTHHLYIKAKDKSLNVQATPLDVTFEVNTKQFDIEIVDLKFKEMFSVLYQHYNALQDIKDNPFGTITLKNNFDKDIKIKINSFAKGYMDFPADTRGKVKAKSTQKLPIRLEFNENVLTAPSGFKKVNISLQYYLHGENKENEMNSNIMIYDKNTITWDDPKKIGAFVTVEERVIENFVRGIIQTYKDESKESVIYGNLIRAMELFDAFGAYGIRYIADPTSPYSGLKNKKGALDTLRFPKQTLALKSGDCDDCVVLYCAALENIGINTAVIDTYDHLFMMFDVGLKKKDLKQVTTDESKVFIDDEDNVWIPVEATLLGKTFSYAWEVAAKKFNEYKDRMDIYYIEDAWETYKPAEVSSTDEEVAAIKVPSKETVDTIYRKDVNIQEGALIDVLVAKYTAKIAEDPDNAQAYNSLGIIFGKNGYLEKAAENFKRVIELKPDFAGGHSNLGNILFEKGYYKGSIKEYKKSLMLKPDNANVYIELAITYSMLDDFVNAKKAYLEAIKIDPDIEKKFIGEGE